MWVEGGGGGGAGWWEDGWGGVEACGVMECRGGEVGVGGEGGREVVCGGWEEGEGVGFWGHCLCVW